MLEEDDPYIPAGSEAPRRGAVPVRFFGTYDFAWIESQRVLQPFEDGFAEKSCQPDEDGFAASVQEAQQFLVRSGYAWHCGCCWLLLRRRLRAVR